MPAKTVLSMAIRYIVEMLWEHPFQRKSDIMFVITVPATWNEESKELMSSAAKAVSYHLE